MTTTQTTGRWHTLAVRAKVASAQLREIQDGTHSDPDAALRQVAAELDMLERPLLAAELRDVAAAIRPDPDETLRHVREQLAWIAELDEWHKGRR